MAIGLITYQDASRREDLIDVLTNVSPKATPLYSGLGSSSAQNTNHEWLVDSFASSADNAAIEGSAATVVDLTAPVRQNNICQMFRKVITVSDTERAVNQAAIGDAFAYQMKKGTTELAKDIEKALIAGTITSGSSGVARRLKGVVSWVSTNKTLRTSGTSFTETEFNDIQQQIWDSTDEFADEIYTGAYLKRVISAFTANATKNVNIADKRLINSVDVYESDFGIHKIFTHREIPSGGILALDSGKWKVAYLRKPKVVDLARTGSATNAMIEGELTLESLNEISSGYRSIYYTV